MVEDSETGSSPITSYIVQWDAGTSGNSWFSIAGETDPYLELDYIFTQLQKGTAYNFKYAVRNIYGSSGFSEIVNQIAARIPEQP